MVADLVQARGTHLQARGKDAGAVAEFDEREEFIDREEVLDPIAELFADVAGVIPEGLRGVA